MGDKKYTITRFLIALILVVEIMLGVKVILADASFWNDLEFPLDKYLFGTIAGFSGLFLRNCYWLFGNQTESIGKNLWLTYLIQYQLFIILSSILISSVLMLSDKVETSSYLFFAFALPLNVYVGLETYKAFDLIKDIIRKNV